MGLNELIEKAKNKAKQIYDATYTDICTIKVYEKNVQNGLTKTFLKIKYENMPCLLCYRKTIPIEQGVFGFNDNVRCLMIDNNIEISENSYIEVLSNGILYKYKNSKSTIFDTHQLVELKEYKDKA